MNFHHDIFRCLSECAKRRSIFLALLVTVLAGKLDAQRVGVVLSGGGATALAHVGFLRVLEANEIPIDCIGGTSMGAVIAAMYASGYSVSEIDSIVRSEDFLLMATGQVNEQFKFFFKNPEPDASMANLKFGGGEFLTEVIPTNLINPVLLDWKFMEGFSMASERSNENFDSLFVPFRCIAADIEKKQQLIFRGGPLNVATRASCTYPFYLPPRRVNGSLLFDGGIYNNFPADVIYQEFLPDVILGCNVSENAAPTDEDNLFSQLETMILFRTDYGHLCESMLVVEPSIDNVGTFDFDRMGSAIDAGYEATVDSLPKIKEMITRRVPVDELNERRRKFKSTFVPLVVESIEIEGLDKSQKTYVTKMLSKNQAFVPLGELKSPYFRVFADERIKSIFPVLKLNRETQKYVLSLEVKKEKSALFLFGGNFSSRAINSGFIGVRYSLFRNSAATFSANSYFGRFYGSVNANLRWDFSSKIPYSIQAGITLNRWDYYKSLATFFEDVKPSFIVMNERFGEVMLRFPAGNKGMLMLGAQYTHQFDEYYQTTQFLSTDTADRTEFDAVIGRIGWERNTLNRKQLANAGTFLSLSAKYVVGRESTIPGTTNIIRDTTHTDHAWITGKLTYTNYFAHKGPITIGLNTELVASTQSFFDNYISSVIAAPSFHPIVESTTLFLPQFRAHSYAAAGGILVVNFNRNVEFRAEAYAFAPYQPISFTDQLEAEYANEIIVRKMLSGAFIYQSPIGPASITLNYYEGKDEPFSFLFNFGYLLFNRSARD